MIAEEKRKAVLTAIEQVQDEEIFDKIAATVQNILSQQRGQAGFLKNSISYLAQDWDAPLTDWKHLHK